MPSVVCLRERPALLARAVAYIQGRWANEASRMVYADCLAHAVDPPSPLPRWYLLLEGEVIAGCAGLIPNDFISRMDLWPWLCALYVEPEYRGHAHGALLIERAKADARKAGYGAVYLCTDHVGYYERYGFSYLADGYHPWGERSRIYAARL